MCGAQFALDETRVELDLVDGGDSIAAVQERSQPDRGVVGDTDRSDQAVRQQLLRRLVGGRPRLGVERSRLVQQVQVQVLQAEVGQAGVEGA